MEMLEVLEGIAEDADAFFEDRSDIDAYELAGAIRDMARSVIAKAGAK
jgi:hypothetical protein